MDGRQTLLGCLQIALPGSPADFLNDIADAALMSGINPVALGSGVVSVAAAKDKLFLTDDEAVAVIGVCEEMVRAQKKPEDDPKQLALRLRATGSNLSVNLSVQAPEDQDAPAPAPAADGPAPAASEGDSTLVLAALMDDQPELGLQAVLEEAEEEEQGEQPASQAAVVATNGATATVSRVAAPEPKAKATPAPVPTAASPKAASPSPKAAAAMTPAKPPSPTAAVRPTPLPRVALLGANRPASAAAGGSSSTPATPVAAPTPRPRSAVPPRSPGALVRSTSPKAFKALALKGPKGLSQSVVLTPSSSYAAKASAAATSPNGTGSPAVPSYLRPTATHNARTAKAGDDSETASLADSSLRASQDSLCLLSKKSRVLLERSGHFCSTLLAPTAAFVSRVTGRADEEKAKKEVPLSKSTMLLESVLASPQGQRVTKPQPFALRADMRPKVMVQSTEELALAAAKEQAFKRNPVPKHVHEARPLEFRVSSTPKDPEAIFEPFKLASLERHTQQKELLSKKQQEEAAAEEAARRFKARPFSAKVAAGALTPPKPEPAPVTRGSAPCLSTEARIKHYHEVIEPVKKAKEAEANKEKLEAEAKARELEEMSLDDFRRTLEFKARAMPDFSAPFKPDPSLARPVTAAIEPTLNIEKRLGKVSARDDKDGPGLGKGVYDGDGYVDPFFASLRKSTATPLSAGAGSTMLRRSIAIGSATTAGRSAPPRAGGGSHSVSVSVGSELQAVIRAAARKAAADIAAAAVAGGGAASSCAEEHSRRGTQDTLPMGGNVLAAN